MSLAAPGSKVAVLGASPKEERYSFKACVMLKEHGFDPIPVHPAGHIVEGVAATKSLSDIDYSIDTLSMYINAKLSAPLTDEIIALKPRRVVFNPGSESEQLAAKLQEPGIETIEACTLVMLRTSQF